MLDVRVIYAVSEESNQENNEGGSSKPHVSLKVRAFHIRVLTADSGSG